MCVIRPTVTRGGSDIVAINISAICSVICRYG